MLAIKWGGHIRQISYVLALFVTAGVGMWAFRSFDRMGRANPGDDRARRATVRRADVYSSLKTFGELASARNTLIEFEIERMSGSESNSGASRYSTLTTVVPEGTYVQQGDVLCEVDSSSYQEQLRLQQITVETARAEHVRARYDLETAEVAYREYVDGLRQQDYQEFEAGIAKAQSDFERQQNRLEWAERVLPLGYISPSRSEEERLALLRCEIALDQAQRGYDSYKQYTEPKRIQSLQARIEQSKSTFIFATRRLETEEDSLVLCRRQVDLCTIRAPHEGYVIYCVDDDDPPIAPGVVVRRHMDLFELPDLSQLEVRAQVNQTVIGRIAEGMPARVRLDSVAGRDYYGTVTHIAALPDQENRRARLTGVSNYVVRIGIESDEPLLPGLSAEIDILTDSRPDSLVIPTEAMTVEDGQQICYVASPEGIERRPVEVDEGTMDQLRVTSGLSEGEQVILDPERINPPGGNEPAYGY